MAGFGSLSAEDEAAMMPETFVNPEVKKAVGNLMTWKPTPDDSPVLYKTASPYANFTQQDIDTGLGVALGVADGGMNAKPLVKSSELATPYHAQLEPPSQIAYNALHGYPNAEATAAPGLDVGPRLGGPSGGSEGVREAQLQAERRAGNRAALEGLPRAPQSIGGEPFVPGPVASVHDVADRYMAGKDFGSYHQPPDKYHPVDPEHSTAIAKAFEEMPHTPNDPATKASYDALVKETLAQYQAIKESGLKITPTTAETYPYHGNPREVAKDVADNNHMAFFKTDDGFGSDPNAKIDLATHPMMQKSGEKIGEHELLNNDLFRIVHDYFGHIKNGYGFRAAGEDNAWRAHAAMYSDLARPAMTTETRGQNSWVNYGPHGEANRTASGADTIYADQKVGLMPEWTMRDRGSPEPIIAYHGTPYSFDKFDMNKLGSGEGNQAYGHGLYFAGHSPVSEWYRHQLAARRDPLLEKYGLDDEQGAHVGIHLASHGGDVDKAINDLGKQAERLKLEQAQGRTDLATKNMIKDREAKIGYLSDPERATGHMYQVAIDRPPEHFLDYDKPFSQQSPYIQEKLQPMLTEAQRKSAIAGQAAKERGVNRLRPSMKPYAESLHDPAGQKLYEMSGLPALNRDEGAPKSTKALREIGVAGIKYLDQHSRSKGTGSSNYVTFDAPRILKRYAVPGAIGATGFGSLAPGEDR